MIVNREKGLAMSDVAASINEVARKLPQIQIERRSQKLTVAMVRVKKASKCNFMNG